MPIQSKQAKEVIFSRKLSKVPHPSLDFNNTNVSQCKSQKCLGIILDSKLTFGENYKTVLRKANRNIGFLSKLQNLLSIETLQSFF